MAKSALVELIIQRDGGTENPMPATPYSPKGATYHFKPTPSDPRHTSMVDDPAHLRRFLAIEGYELADDIEAVPARGIGQSVEGVGVGGQQTDPLASDTVPIILTVDGGDLLNKLAVTSGHVDPVAPSPTDPLMTPRETDLRSMTLADLRVVLKEQTGQNASPKHDAEILIQKILLSEAKAPIT